MGYIGNQPGYGKPEVYVFTATGGETSVTTADDGRSVNYAVGYVSVYLNGVRLVEDTDFTATTGSSITGLSALSASDVVTIVSFETFAIPDAVSEQNGGTFQSSITVEGMGTFNYDSDQNLKLTRTSAPDFEFVTSTSGFGQIQVDDGAGNVGTIRLDTSGNLQLVQSGAGLSFTEGSGQTSANTLDDYEEGTWTPTYSFSTSGDVSAGQHAVQDGFYTKVGDTVIAHGFLRTTSLSGASGNASIKGLPFTSNSDANFRSGGGIGQKFSFATDMPNFHVRVGSNASEVNLYDNATNAANSSVSDTDFATGTNDNNLAFTVTYKV